MFRLPATRRSAIMRGSGFRRSVEHGTREPPRQPRRTAGLARPGDLRGAADPCLCVRAAPGGPGTLLLAQDRSDDDRSPGPLLLLPARRSEFGSGPVLCRRRRTRSTPRSGFVLRRRGGRARPAPAGVAPARSPRKAGLLLRRLAPLRNRAGRDRDRRRRTPFRRGRILRARRVSPPLPAHPVGAFVAAVGAAAGSLSLAAPLGRALRLAPLSFSANFAQSAKSADSIEAEAFTAPMLRRVTDTVRPTRKRR